MAIPHARPGEIINVRPLTDGLTGARTTVLVKTDRLEIIRLIVPRDKEIPSHATRGEITVQCLEGRIAFSSSGVQRELSAGDMLYLEAGRPHSVKGIDDASLLLTITFPAGSPAEDPSACAVAEFDSDAADLVDEASLESFPASDPPSYIHGHGAMLERPWSDEDDEPSQSA